MVQSAIGVYLTRETANKGILCYEEDMMFEDYIMRSIHGEILRIYTIVQQLLIN